MNSKKAKLLRRIAKDDEEYKQIKKVFKELQRMNEKDPPSSGMATPINMGEVYEEVRKVGDRALASAANIVKNDPCV